MNAWFSLALKSAWHRRLTLSLVVASIALSSLLLFSIERVRMDVRTSFSQAVSGTDLVVGARSGALQLMLYAVFHVGEATNNLRMESVDAIGEYPEVAWIVPISLGDSHRGFSVLGTTAAYFSHFLYGDKQALQVSQGRVFNDSLDGLYEVVLGAEVARQAGYQLGQKILVKHGMAVLGPEHADKPFTVVGVLATTGTPVDRTLFLSLRAIEAIHLDWVAGAPMPGFAIAAQDARKFDLTPKQVTAALVGLNSRARVFAVQRKIASYTGEPLMAVLPGVALDQLWQVLGAGEKALIGLSFLVALVSVAGLVAVILAGLNERRRELAVLRAIGAGPRHILFLLVCEGLLITGLGVVLGLLLCLGLMAALGPWLSSAFGIYLEWSPPRANEWALMGLIAATGFIASLVPALRAYFLSLSDGLSPR